MKEKINKILWDFAQSKLTHEEATQQVLDLFAVVGRSEQFYCADWNRCGATCEEQCNKCKKAEDMPEVAQ
jgi:hypothetical protein